MNTFKVRPLLIVVISYALRTMTHQRRPCKLISVCRVQLGNSARLQIILTRQPLIGHIGQGNFTSHAACICFRTIRMSNMVRRLDLRVCGGPLLQMTSIDPSDSADSNSKPSDTSAPLGAGKTGKLRPSIEAIALLGRRDQPTDGVYDYCKYLSAALARRGDSLKLVDLRWDVYGWRRALADLWRRSRSWKNRPVLLQYTALMWSARGFPLGALAVIAILKWRRVRLGVVFHDVDYQPTRGVIRWLRVACQKFCIRSAFRCAEFPILTVPAPQIPWLGGDSNRATFIPVGANFPPSRIANVRTDFPVFRTVAVFGVTGDAQIGVETRDIAYVMKEAAAAGLDLRLDVFGRNAIEAESTLRKELGDAQISLSVAGVLPAEEVRARLSEADVLLFVRGPISSRRGSALAGIVCGTPVVGYRGAETAPPITEAGVILVPLNDRAALIQALTAVLNDARLNQELRQRNSAITDKYLSWDAIASRFACALSKIPA